MGACTARLGDSLHFEARNLTLPCRKFCNRDTEQTALVEFAANYSSAAVKER
jgi:hypothetical protein